MNTSELAGDLREVAADDAADAAKRTPEQQAEHERRVAEFLATGSAS